MGQFPAALAVTIASAPACFALLGQAAPRSHAGKLFFTNLIVAPVYDVPGACAGAAPLDSGSLLLPDLLEWIALVIQYLLSSSSA